MNISDEVLCPKCSNPLPKDSYFCPRCGTKIKENPVDTSIGKQILIYFVSFFLAPFGLGYTIKYLKHKDSKAKKIGIASLVLTILSIGLVLWLGMTSITAYKSILDIEIMN